MHAFIILCVGEPTHAPIPVTRFKDGRPCPVHRSAGIAPKVLLQLRAHPLRRVKSVKKDSQ